MAGYFVVSFESLQESPQPSAGSATKTVYVASMGGFKGIVHVAFDPGMGFNANPAGVNLWLDEDEEEYAMVQITGETGMGGILHALGSGGSPTLYDSAETDFTCN